MWHFLETASQSPFFIVFFVTLAFYPFLWAFIRKLIRHNREAEARARAADCTMQWYDPRANWSPQDEIVRLEAENEKMHTRIEELEHQLGDGGPYRSPGTVAGCACPCTGKCGEGFGLGPSTTWQCDCPCKGGCGERCNCPCTGMCSEWRPPGVCPCGGMCGSCDCDCAGPGGHDAPEPVSLQRGPGGILFAGLDRGGVAVKKRRFTDAVKERSFAVAEVEREMKDQETPTFVQLNRTDVGFILDELRTLRASAEVRPGVNLSDTMPELAPVFPEETSDA